MDISDLRSQYVWGKLDRENLHADPFIQFSKWFKEALEAKINEPNAMALSTVGHGHPSCRMVLLKAWGPGGFVFYTSYVSRKGQQLAHYPHAAVTLFWKELERQICFEGRVEKVSREESALYFASRPRESQITAWVSAQRATVNSRKELEDRFTAVTEQYEGKEIPLPPDWGGYRIIPNRYEFWQGRPYRLHDRFLYEKLGDNWELFRLSP